MSFADLGAISTTYVSVLYSDVGAAGFHDTSMELAVGVRVNDKSLLGGLLRNPPNNILVSLKQVPPEPSVGAIMSSSSSSSSLRPYTERSFSGRGVFVPSMFQSAAASVSISRPCEFLW